eukprot:976468-Prymnesium_polylepis.1
MALPGTAEPPPRGAVRHGPLRRGHAAKHADPAGPVAIGRQRAMDHLIRPPRPRPCPVSGHCMLLFVSSFLFSAPKS